MGPHQSKYQEALARVAAGEKIFADDLRRMSAAATQEARLEQEDLVRALRGEEPLVGRLRRPKSYYKSPATSPMAEPQKPEWYNPNILDNGPIDDEEIIQQVLSNVAGEVERAAFWTSEPRKLEHVPAWMYWKSPKEIPINPELDFFSPEFERKLGNLLKGWYVKDVGHRPDVMKEIGMQVKDLAEVKGLNPEMRAVFDQVVKRLCRV